MKNCKSYGSFSGAGLFVRYWSIVAESCSHRKVIDFSTISDLVSVKFGETYVSM